MISANALLMCTSGLGFKATQALGAARLLYVPIRKAECQSVAGFYGGLLSFLCSLVPFPEGDERVSVFDGDGEMDVASLLREVLQLAGRSIGLHLVFPLNHEGSETHPRCPKF